MSTQNSADKELKLTWISGIRKESYLKKIKVALKVSKNNYLMPNKYIKFTLDGTDIKFSDHSKTPQEIIVSTDILGRAKVEISAVNKKVGKFKLNACLYADSSIKAPSLELEFINPQVSSLTLQTVTDNQIANGSAEDRIIATVYDENGHSLSQDIEVDFTSTSNEVTIVTPKVLTDQNGKSSTNLTSRTPGQFSITATAGGRSATVSVTFLPIVPPVKEGDFRLVSVYWNPQRKLETAVIAARDEKEKLLKGKNVSVEPGIDNIFKMLRFDNKTDIDTGTFNIDLSGNEGDSGLLTINASGYCGSLAIVIGQDPKNANTLGD
ncbi:putative invasin [Rahnella aquatilis CIP 78.65 = ATCC 33071]|jgi:Bacterial Ig-like domain (group 1).|uniref:Ig-like domain-containing protein n=1 Tax=Rahnella aquatilis (strain ATCC 33071 / DSM 4594 / JCM 1683 / NBRC 105701 / NCIMB 13365 / CIP 78.65) TaxID=745277 RepID=H2IRN3_RAHAC|nr:Ig-like domain-containing protein [Rahnella aquatilis]AEX52534.1 Ig-like domain-containing protein [Rahnella aquatilis CIP 78.65 = ATCC 33071]KFD06613.1 putative invasin [Rahnella aquatilis CIP 78.65 = ATCC 33071]